MKHNRILMNKQKLSPEREARFRTLLARVALYKRPNQWADIFGSNEPTDGMGQ